MTPRKIIDDCARILAEEGYPIRARQLQSVGDVLDDIASTVDCRAGMNRLEAIRRIVRGEKVT